MKQPKTEPAQKLKTPLKLRWEGLGGTGSQREGQGKVRGRLGGEEVSAEEREEKQELPAVQRVGALEQAWACQQQTQGSHLVASAVGQHQQP